MELGLVPAGTIKFFACVDKLIRFLSHPFEYVNAFLVTQHAVVCPKCLDGADRVSFP